MNKTQLEYLKKTHHSYLSSRNPTEPQLLHHLRRALVNAPGTIKLRARGEIVKAAVQQMTDYSYNSGNEMPLSRLFQPPASYYDAQKEHHAALKNREAALKKYRATADDLMRSAELEDNADAKVIAIGLERAARAAGLIQ